MRLSSVLFCSSEEAVGVPDVPCRPCLNRTFNVGLRKVLSHLPVNLPLLRGACCPWLSAQFPGSLWPWVTGGKAFCTFGPFYLPSPPDKLDLGRESIVIGLRRLFFDIWWCRHPIQLRLPLSDPEPKGEVGGLELHSCCSSSSSDTFLVCPLAPLMGAGWPWEADSYQSFAV